MGSTKRIWDGNKNGEGNRMNRGGANYTKQSCMDEIKFMVLFYLM